MSDKKTLLHEILAVDSNLASTAEAIMEEAKVTFSKKAHIFNGSLKSTHYFDEARQGENTEDLQSRSDTVPSKLAYVSGAVGRHYDTLLVKEEANTRAKADLVLDDGTVLATGLPATFLLSMQGRLQKLRDVYLAVPTLDPTYEWKESPDEGEGVYRANVTKGLKTEKIEDYKVIVQATDKHPAQVAKTVKDEAVAEVLTMRTSGMLTPARKSELIGRLDQLIAAVKQARQRANTVEIEQRKISADLFGWLHR